MSQIDFNNNNRVSFSDSDSESENPWSLDFSGKRRTSADYTPLILPEDREAVQWLNEVRLMNKDVVRLVSLNEKQPKELYIYNFKGDWLPNLTSLTRLEKLHIGLHNGTNKCDLSQFQPSQTLTHLVLKHMVFDHSQMEWMFNSSNLKSIELEDVTNVSFEQIEAKLLTMSSLETVMIDQVKYVKEGNSFKKDSSYTPVTSIGIGFF